MQRFWMEFGDLLYRHGMVCARSAKRASYATFSSKQQKLRRELGRLLTGKLVCADGSRRPAYKLESPYNLDFKHVQALAEDWCARGLSVAQVHNLLSAFRVFGRWIGKPGLVPRTEKILHDPKYRRRTQVATRDKSWRGTGVDAEAVIHKISETEPKVAMVLDLMRTFGLRVKEASLLRPHFADQTHYLDVRRGCKGGRPRVVAINSQGARDVLERAKRIVPNPLGCLIPETRSYKSWSNHVYYVLRKNGISRKTIGTSSHGLRHERLQNEYLARTGAPCPVAGGQPNSVDSTTDRVARTHVSALAGHARRSVSSAYLGQFLRGARKIPPQTKIGTKS